MKKELQDSLKRDFAYLFRFMWNEDYREPISIFGIECGSGWYDPIRKACEAIPPEAGVGVTQIKEKWGGIRFYFNINPGFYGKIEPIIEQLEKECAMTCENCGKRGSISTNAKGWWSCLCDDCRGKINAA